MKYYDGSRPAEYIPWNLHADLSGMIVSFVNHEGNQVKDNHNGKFDMLCNFTHCSDIVRTVSTTLLQLAAIAHMRTTHAATDKNPKLE